MKKILFTFYIPSEYLTEFNNKYEIFVPEKGSLKREEVMRIIHNYEVIVPNFTFQTDKEMIDKGVKLELISNCAVGFNNVDVDYAKEKGVLVTNIPNSVREPTAEFAFALLLAAARNMGSLDRNIRSHKGVKWGFYDELSLTTYSKSLGIIGMGRIGQAIARRALAFGMTIQYNNRHLLSKEIEEQYQATYVPFETLLRQSDFISLNAPSTPETLHMIGKKEFEMMKPTAVFVNTARGNMVDEEALVEALKNGTIAAAGIDVFEKEPKIHPGLLELENVVLAPHAATRTVEARKEMTYEIIHNIIGFYEGTYSISKVNI
ncbi:MAG: NAD(P)-dependent oxidoreductase [Dysgonamonadaceae bacterium]